MVSNIYIAIPIRHAGNFLSKRDQMLGELKSSITVLAGSMQESMEVCSKACTDCR